MRWIAIDEKTGEVVREYRITEAKGRRVRMHGSFIKVYKRAFSTLVDLTPKAAKAFLCVLPYMDDGNELVIEGQKFTICDLMRVAKMSEKTAKRAYAELKAQNIIRAANGKLYINPNFVFCNLVTNSKIVGLFTEGNE